MNLRIRYIWKYLPVIIVYWRKIPFGLIGICLGPLVLITQSHLNDKPTLIHELEHCKQFWRGGLIVHFVRYWTSSTYRLNCEIDAFSVEILCYPYPLRQEKILAYANAISHAYALSISREHCSLLLEKKLKFLQKNAQQSHF